MSELFDFPESSLDAYAEFRAWLTSEPTLQPESPIDAWMGRNDKIRLARYLEARGRFGVPDTVAREATGYRGEDPGKSQWQGEALAEVREAAHEAEESKKKAEAWAAELARRATLRQPLRDPVEGQGTPFGAHAFAVAEGLSVDTQFCDDMERPRPDLTLPDGRLVWLIRGMPECIAEVCHLATGVDWLLGDFLLPVGHRRARDYNGQFHNWLLARLPANKERVSEWRPWTEESSARCKRYKMGFQPSLAALAQAFHGWTRRQLAMELVRIDHIHPREALEGIRRECLTRAVPHSRTRPVTREELFAGAPPITVRETWTEAEEVEFDTTQIERDLIDAAEGRNCYFGVAPLAEMSEAVAPPDPLTTALEEMVSRANGELGTSRQLFAKLSEAGVSLNEDDPRQHSRIKGILGRLGFEKIERRGPLGYERVFVRRGAHA